MNTSEALKERNGVGDCNGQEKCTVKDLSKQRATLEKDESEREEN